MMEEISQEQIDRLPYSLLAIPLVENPIVSWAADQDFTSWDINHE
jgi:hypothetical protein